MKDRKPHTSRVDELSPMDRDREANRLGLDSLVPYAETSSDTNVHVKDRNHPRVKIHNIHCTVTSIYPLGEKDKENCNGRACHEVPAKPTRLSSAP